MKSLKLTIPSFLHLIKTAEVRRLKQVGLFKSFRVRGLKLIPIEYLKDIQKMRGGEKK